MSSSCCVLLWPAPQRSAKHDLFCYGNVDCLGGASGLPKRANPKPTGGGSKVMPGYAVPAKATCNVMKHQALIPKSNHPSPLL